MWLFAQTTLNVAPTMREELGISESLTNTAVSITALFWALVMLSDDGEIAIKPFLTGNRRQKLIRNYRTL